MIRPSCLPDCVHLALLDNAKVRVEQTYKQGIRFQGIRLMGVPGVPSEVKNLLRQLQCG